MTREEVDAAIHALVFETLGIRRYVQDGPIRPDVWINYILAALAGKSDARVSLIITPKRTSSPEGKAAASPAAIARTLKERLNLLHGGPKQAETTSPQTEAATASGTTENDVASSTSLAATRIGLTTRYVVADLTYDEMFTCLLPMTDWWNRLPEAYRNGAILKKHLGSASSKRSASAESSPTPESRDKIEDIFRRFQDKSLLRLALLATTIESLNKKNLHPANFNKWIQLISHEKRSNKIEKSDDLYALIQEVTSTDLQRNESKKKSKKTKPIERSKSSESGVSASSDSSFGEMKKYFQTLIDKLRSIKSIFLGSEVEKNSISSVWGIELNRSATPPAVKKKRIPKNNNKTPIEKSRAPSLPGIELSRNTVKADAAIRLFNLSTSHLTWAIVDTGIDTDHPAFCDWDTDLKEDGPPRRPHRIAAAYDFTRLRQIQTEELTKEELKKLLPEAVTKNIDELIDAIIDYDGVKTGEARNIDWASVGPILRVYDEIETNTVPSNPHGTHVAGILAGWLPAGAVKDIPSPFYGVCPDIRLYDLRVFSDDPRHGNDEFTILAALDFISWLNRDPEQPVIHGVNLSLSLRHQVDAHACGRTPICEAANRLTYSGAVVVAAAGNAGYEPNASRESRGSGYRDISITDPGNAEEVICVGATHRSEPHTYGVSFFSSRGPTGDGRQKPDLVAPGEKIRSSIPGKKFDLLDGTSMAAPHVSGVCALLMARHRELIGEPARIKDILKKTATDLGRTPEFQGAGLVDALRALQSL